MLSCWWAKLKQKTCVLRSIKDKLSVREKVNHTFIDCFMRLQRRFIKKSPPKMILPVMRARSCKVIDQSRCRRPLNLTTPFCSWGDKPREVPWLTRPGVELSFVTPNPMFLNYSAFWILRAFLSICFLRVQLTMCLSYFPNKIVSPLRAGTSLHSTTPIVFYI